ncbi:hypothetical protein ACJMK2_004657, partial [Sinanodonta woodiana]
PVPARQGDRRVCLKSLCQQDKETGEYALEPVPARQGDRGVCLKSLCQQDKETKEYSLRACASKTRRQG